MGAYGAAPPIYLILSAYLILSYPRLRRKIGDFDGNLLPLRLSGVSPRSAIRARMAGIIIKVFEAEMTAEQLRVLAGKARCKDASTKVELAYGALLAVVQKGDAGFEALPVAVQRSIDASAVCNALVGLDEADADWVALRHAMQQLPPAALLHILSEEMTAEQMRTLAGKARCEEAKTKAQLAFAVLLTLSLRASGIKGLPANAEQRIEASPVCVDWLAELAISRLRPDYDGGWREFMCVVPRRTLALT
jgi:hypothetical protein